MITLLIILKFSLALICNNAACHVMSSVVFVLGEKPDLKKAFKHLLPISTEWKSIGIFLDLPSNSLNRIAAEEQGVNSCLQAMLSEWLKKVDPHPSWAQLIEAVEPFDAAKAAELRTLYEPVYSNT